MISRFLIPCLLLLLWSGNIYPKEPPQPHRFFDAPNVALQSANVAVQLGGLWATERGLRNNPRFREKNPLLQTHRARVAAKAAAIGSSFGLAYLFHRLGWHKAERFIPVAFAVPHGIAFAYDLHLSGRR